jgi:hypothetical protein
MMIDTDIFGIPSLPKQIRTTSYTVAPPIIPIKSNKKSAKMPEPPAIAKNKATIKDYFRKIQSYHLRNIGGTDGLLPF